MKTKKLVKPEPEATPDEVAARLEKTQVADDTPTTQLFDENMPPYEGEDVATAEDLEEIENIVDETVEAPEPDVVDTPVEASIAAPDNTEVFPAVEQETVAATTVAPAITPDTSEGITPEGGENPKEEPIMNERKNIIDWVKTHRKQSIGIGAGAAAAIIALAFGIAALTHPAEPTVKPDVEKPAVEQVVPTPAETEKDANTVTYQLDITAPDWNDDSTPALILFDGQAITDNGPAVIRKYHAVTASEVAEHKATLDLQPGEYTIQVISPVNADGSIYNVPEPQKVVVADPNADKAEDAADNANKSSEITDNTDANADKPAEDTPLVITANLSKIDAKDVTELQLNTIYEYFDTAHRNSDGTLEGDKGKAVMDKLWENMNAAPVMKDKAANSQSSETKSEEQKTNSPNNSSNNSSNQSSTNRNSNSSSNSSSNNSSSNSNTSQRTQVWVDEVGHYEDITEQVWVENWVTVVDEPAYTDRVANGYQYYFSADGYTTSDAADANAHSVYLNRNDMDPGYETETVYTYVEVPAKTHQEDQGHYETRVTGQRWVVDTPGHYEYR